MQIRKSQTIPVCFLRPQQPCRFQVCMRLESQCCCLHILLSEFDLTLLFFMSYLLRNSFGKMISFLVNMAKEQQIKFLLVGLRELVLTYSVCPEKGVYRMGGLGHKLYPAVGHGQEKQSRRGCRSEKQGSILVQGKGLLFDLPLRTPLLLRCHPG